MSSSKNIRLMRSSVIYGPFSADQLRHMASTQKIKSTDLVSIDNGPWKPIKLSVNAEQQKPASQQDKPSKPAEISSEPKAPIIAANLPPLYRKITNSIMNTCTYLSNKLSNPTTEPQSVTPKISIDSDDANKLSIPTTPKNNFATALGCGAIILPCLFCGFLGMFLPERDLNNLGDVRTAEGRPPTLAELREYEARHGNRPNRSSWDGSYKEVTDYLSIHLKDPSSVNYIEWYLARMTPTGWRVGVKYRAKNSFGGMNIEEKYFLIINGKAHPF